jgi:hypothetical protein
MALGFSAMERPCICYYELTTSPKRRKLELADMIPFDSWVSISFSNNTESKRLASLTNKNEKGEALLVFWNPERGKCEAQLRLCVE